MTWLPVFVGPTLWNDPVLRDDRFDWRPPAAEGDVYRVVRDRPAAIGLIDGRFESLPSVWHKEILWALSKGIPVYGAASMGALRAAELHTFGMIGVGVVFEAYRSGAIRNDDEVALLHAPKALGYRPLSEALVDIRATATAAELSRIVSHKTALALVALAQTLFFKDRSWEALLVLGRARGLPKLQLAALADWLRENRVDQKRRDALLMLAAMRRAERSRRRAQPRFVFQRTVHWQKLVDRHTPC